MGIEIKRRMGLPRMRFHVMNRGARKVDIYSTDEDREHFVSLLSKAALKHHITIIAWCLMSNHYHLEAEGEGTPLTQMMHDLDGPYAKAYNEKYESSGCLFQGRFKSMAVTGEDGLLYVSRYIHANPIAQGRRPEEYPWSSCKAYLGEEAVPAWLDPRPVLDLMGSDPVSAYRAYLDAAPPPRVRNGRDIDDRREFYLEYVRHLGMRCLAEVEEVGGRLGELDPVTVFSWIARKKFGIPVSILAEIGGAGDPMTTRVRVWRLERLLGRDADLAMSAEEVFQRMSRVR